MSVPASGPVTLFTRRTCIHCDRPLTDLQRYRGAICDGWRCREAQLARELRDHRARAARALGEGAPERYPIAVVEHAEAPLVPLPPERRRAHRVKLVEGLRRVLRARRAATAAGATGTEPGAGAGAESEGEPERPPTAFEGRLCAACRGSCCHDGGDHAFLDDPSLRRVVRDHPQRAVRTLPRLYLDHLPDESFEGSCVYHGRRGCTLPRDLRGNLCNRFLCRGLREAEERAATMEEARACLVVRSDHRIIRSAFLDDRGTRFHDPG